MVFLLFYWVEYLVPPPGWVPGHYRDPPPLEQGKILQGEDVELRTVGDPVTAAVKSTDFTAILTIITLARSGVLRSGVLARSRVLARSGVLARSSVLARSGVLAVSVVPFGPSPGLLDTDCVVVVAAASPG